MNRVLASSVMNHTYGIESGCGLSWPHPIVAALQAHDVELYSKFPFDGSDQLDEQVVKASAEAETAPVTRGAKGKARAKHRG